eukprot:gene18025-27102_t
MPSKSTSVICTPPPPSEGNTVVPNGWRGCTMARFAVRLCLLCFEPPWTHAAGAPFNTLNQTNRGSWQESPRDACKAAYATTKTFVAAGLANHIIDHKHMIRMGIPVNYEDKKGKVTNYTFDNSVLFVHIGKAGGGAVESHLQRAGIRFDQIHVSYTPGNALLSHDWIIVCVRDPVARLVSAYNWNNPASAKKGHKHASSVVNFYKCFPNVNAWVRAFRSHSGGGSGGGSGSTEAPALCGQIAFNAKGIEDIPKIAHMSVKTDSPTYSSPLVACSYIGLFLDDFVTSDVAASMLQHLYVLQTEQLDDDFSHFQSVLERRAPEIVKKKGVNVNKNTHQTPAIEVHHVGLQKKALTSVEPGHHVGLQKKALTSVEPDVRRYLETILAPEYLVLNRLMQLSANKNESNYYCTHEGTIATAPLCEHQTRT